MEEEDFETDFNWNLWKFADIFENDTSRETFLTRALLAFSKFPPDTRLNCNDFYSILSFLSRDLPYNFVAFVCECIDPTISTGTLLGHRMAFGNFLMALPPCVLFPQFMHRFLTMFKTSDRFRDGVINRKVFLDLLNQTFHSFLSDKRKDSRCGEEEEEEDSSDDTTSSEDSFDVYELTIEPQRLPSRDIIREVRRATVQLEDCSVQTLLFVMWQKEPALLKCKEQVAIGEAPFFAMEGAEEDGPAEDAAEPPADAPNDE